MLNFQPRLLDRHLSRYVGLDLTELPASTQGVLGELTTSIVGGGTFYDRIFNVTDGLKQDLVKNVRQGLLGGETFDQVRDRVQKAFGVDKLDEPTGPAYGSVKTYKNEARRQWNLLMKDLGDKTEDTVQVWWSTLDERSTPGCVARHAYPIEEDDDPPPRHLNCRCIVAIFPADHDFTADRQEAMIWLSAKGYTRRRAMLKEAFDAGKHPRDDEGQFASTGGGADYKRVAAGDRVDGRKVRAEIPNRGSIDASLSNYKVLPGVREVPFSVFKDMPDTKTYSRTERERVEKLAAAIKDSKEIAPLIVVDDGDPRGPYVLEGGHRFDALRALGATSFPALVVHDLDAMKKKTSEAEAVQAEVFDSGKHPRDPEGQFSSTGGSGATGSGPAPVYHVTRGELADQIKAEGLKRGGRWRNRAPSVYYTTTLDAARKYAAILPTVSGYGGIGPPAHYVVVEFKRPTKKEIADNYDANLKRYRIDSYRVSSDIPASDIIAIHHFDREEGNPNSEYKHTTVRASTQAEQRPAETAFAVILLDPGKKEREAEFDPGKHPRDPEGQFASTGAASFGRMKHDDFPDKAGPPGEHMYHTTSQDNLDAIASGGLKPHGPSHRGEQTEWPNGGRDRRVYFAARPGGALNFAEPDHVLLRVKTDSAQSKGLKAEFKDRDYYVSGKSIPASQIEILQKDGTWKPLKSKEREALVPGWAWGKTTIQPAYHANFEMELYARHKVLHWRDVPRAFAMDVESWSEILTPAALALDRPDCTIVRAYGERREVLTWEGWRTLLPGQGDWIETTAGWALDSATIQPAWDERQQRLPLLLLGYYPALRTVTFPISAGGYAMKVVDFATAEKLSMGLLDPGEAVPDANESFAALALKVLSVRPSWDPYLVLWTIEGLDLTLRVIVSLATGRVLYSNTPFDGVLTAPYLRVAGAVFEPPRSIWAVIPRGMYEWVLPGGHIEPGELPRAAVVREMREETGLDVVPQREIGRIYRPWSTTIVYLCRRVAEPTDVATPEEIDAASLIPFDQLSADERGWLRRHLE
jgi:ADP-ribose pyrophosphatase YjhB (NUDIX family)